MPTARSARLWLYAALPAAERHAACPTIRGVRYVRCGPVIAAVGRPKPESARYAARRHDRVLGRLLAVCSSVVPFRFGVDLGSEAELRDLLRVNLDELCRHLARVHDRVEMGARVKLPAWDPSVALRLKSGLGPVRALAPSPDDRRERLQEVATGKIFEGCYLIARRAIDAFWSALDESRFALGGLPVLGSGPWAAYSFCDVVLHPGPTRAAVGSREKDR